MRIFSGIQASGTVHLGNYLGAIKQHIELQDSADQAFYAIVDLHAITIPQDPAELRSNTLQVGALYLALGLDPQKAPLFVQSQVPAHAEIAWILTTLTTLGELDRMTQFKEKGRGSERGAVEAGLYSYPILMAADILAYGTTHVPAGEDQVQHIELARDLAKRFNHRFGDTFVVPQAMVPEHGARVMGLDDPTKKMSKSASSNYNYLALTDTADTIRKKIKKAVTDSGSGIEFSNDKPALKNLITLFAGVTNQPPHVIARQFEGRGYAEFKDAIADATVAFLEPIQEKYHAIMADEASLINTLHAGAERARSIANETLSNVKEKVGFIR